MIHPRSGRCSISVEFDLAGAPAAELQCALRGERGALSETWIYRWIA